jgi:nucleotide-binding universal stress UspA family protein
VATDRTDASLPALQAAKVLNRSLHSGVKVLVVIEPLPVIVPEPSSLLQPLVITPELEALVRKQTLAQMKTVEDDPAAWSLDVEQGKPPSEIAAAARAHGASLVIIGQSHHGIVDRLIDGDTALDLLRECDTPVLLASAEFVSLPRVAVIAVDFSPDSMEAARVALPMLSPGCVIHLAHVRPSVTIFDGSGLWEEEYERVAARQLEEFKKTLNAPATMSVDTTILAGKPARALTDFAKQVDADLIVSGTHGTGLIRRILIGSVASGLIRKAERSLLVVPAPIQSGGDENDEH